MNRNSSYTVGSSRLWMLWGEKESQRTKNTAIVLVPTQQNVKGLWTFSASISVELIKVFLAGREKQTLTKSMRPTAKSTNTSEHIWLIFPSRQYIYTHARPCPHTHSHTQRQICETQCPCDPYAPYGQEEGRENKHTALWVIAAWQPAKPRGSWCWSNTAMAGTTLFSVAVLMSCFI